MPQLAQLNVARRRLAEDDPSFQEFLRLLAPVNALADASPGFLWRLQSETGNAADFHLFGDERLVVNFSSWESVEALRAFLGRPEHVAVFRRRGEWFEAHEEAHMVLFWVPVGSTPSLEEAGERLLHRRRYGPTERAFDLGCPFAPPPAIPNPG